MLNALFGMNTAAHRVNMLSPILFSHVTSTSIAVGEPQTGLVDILLQYPLDHMISSLTIRKEVGVVEDTDGGHGNVPVHGIKR